VPRRAHRSRSCPFAPVFHSGADRHVDTLVCAQRR